MNQLGLEVSGPSTFRAKLVNNVTIKCLGVIHDVKVKGCGIEAVVDTYVMPSKGEGYPIILGRPWLMAMQATQDWEAGLLVMKTPEKGGARQKKVVFNMREGCQESLEWESSEDETSREETTSATKSEVTSKGSDSSLEVMGLAVAQHVKEKKPHVTDSQLKEMLSEELTNAEEDAYLTVLREHSNLFISDYEHITGVTAIQHRIRLMEESKPVAQKLQRLGAVQQDALLREVQKFLDAGFIYPVEDSEWVSTCSGDS